MVKRRLLFIVALASTVGVVAGDSLDDFSNNLSTDLGPLLSLFGDAMTKQFLSESTTFLDYLIFAMAPIGILTAIVSAIRLCGHNSLRAFVGRSQEGEGAVEAELCTSTSRDVCELFNQGGIARVLGRPNVLELVYKPPAAAGTTSESAGVPELHLTRKYFEGSASSSHWQKVDGSVFPRPSKSYGVAEEFAPNANISLNVGIVRRPEWEHVAIAIMGVVLQSGVLALAGVGVWILGWNLNSGHGPASRDYAPAMFICGTIVMCAGMWGCAYLIGQATREVRFRRINSSNTPPKLLWLQPGPQVIGDQSFDPYSYIEDTDKNPHQLWISSRKDFDQSRFENYTLLAISATSLGYLAQFIGLRGMKAWVSLAQLGITLVMSFLRGCLRMQRLGKESNLLGDTPDLVSGHELDWLAFRVAEHECKWYVTGRYQQAQGVTHRGRESLDKAKVGDKKSAKSESVTSESVTSASLDFKSKTAVKVSVLPVVPSSGEEVQHLLQIRKRLAHLTGNTAFGGLSSSEYQKWEVDVVKVRAKANQISTAVCRIMEKVTLKSQFAEIQLRVQATSGKVCASSQQNEFVNVVLRGGSSSHRGWVIDTATIEAVLGLWLWSLTVDPVVQPSSQKNLSPNEFQCSANDVSIERLVSASPAGTSGPGRASKVQKEMDLWLGPNAVNFEKRKIMVNAGESQSLATLWKCKSSKDGPCWESLAEDETNPDSALYRFCGWTPVHQTQSSGELDVQSVKLYSNETSLLDVCAQELFTALILSLQNMLIFSDTNVVESASKGRLENQTIEIIANEFVKSGLGGYSDVLVGIIPGLKEAVPGLGDEKLMDQVMVTANHYRQNSEWERAESLLQWITEVFRSPDEKHLKFEQIAPRVDKASSWPAMQAHLSVDRDIWPEIVAAHYGGLDITMKAKRQCCHGETIIMPTAGGDYKVRDPWENVEKTLSVFYRFGKGEIRGAVAIENSSRLTLTASGESETRAFKLENHRCDVSNNTQVQIHSIIWGLKQITDKKIYDELYRKYIQKEEIHLTNELFGGDTWLNKEKTAVIVYSTNDIIKCISGRESSRILFSR